MTFFEIANEKYRKCTSDHTAQRSVRRMQQGYSHYSSQQYRFVAATCSQAHFFVVDVTFDLRHTDIFQKVTVYDSLRKTGRNRDDGRLNIYTKGAEFLLALQQFLMHYCLSEDDDNDKSPMLLLSQQPNLILDKCTVCSCPQQQNGHDCGLFAFVVLLHLASDIAVNKDSFTQAQITQFRSLLSGHLRSTTKMERISFHQQLLLKCFPGLPTPSTQTVTDGHDDDHHNSSICSSTTDENEKPPADTTDGTGAVAESGTSKDIVFLGMFTESGGNSILYPNQEAISVRITEYEDITGLRLVIRQGFADARTYHCNSHDGCCFKAKFGPKRGTDQVLLKPHMSVLEHSGPRIYPRTKERLKVRVFPVVDKVSELKLGAPTAGDVVKASAVLNGYRATYQQAYQAVVTKQKGDYANNSQSFQLIVPYMKEFEELNPNSVTMVEKDDATGAMKRVFICPGLMQRSMQYVRPVMSLDAAHLKSEWKGTLYVASVKSACDEIYPVAIAIMEDNENLAGWRWFLGHLDTALPILSAPHPKTEVTKKYFTFICDRQKGLLEALHEVFPHNHSCFCAVHIARNVQMRHGGKRMSKYVLPLAYTFSPRFANELLAKMTAETRAYVEGIERNRWRNTAWLEDPTLPPRYGVRTSNLSEGTNSMFEAARNCSWIYSIDRMLTKMMERISALRMVHEGKEGVVEDVVGILTARWEYVAQYNVVQLEEDGDIFSVLHKHEGRTREAEQGSASCCTLDLELARCSCGEWQDHGIPCVHALAYLKERGKLSFEEVLLGHVNKHYTYGMEKQLLQKNIRPVCIDRLFPDGNTLPPSKEAVNVKAAGRPRKRRLRARSRWRNDAENSRIVCSRCGKPGHNIRTCALRESMETGADRNAGPEETKRRKRGLDKVKELDLS